MAVGQSILTVEEFWEQYAGKPFELVNGEVKPVSPTGYEHGSVIRRTGAILGDFVDLHALGDVVGGETGFRLSAALMRAADVAFIGSAKLATVTEPSKYLPFAPDLAIEVVSPNDTADEIHQKAQMYLDAGTPLVWVLYPSLRQIVVYHPDGTTKRFTQQDVIDGGEVLPEFSAAVSDFFPPQRQPDTEE